MDRIQIREYHNLSKGTNMMALIGWGVLGVFFFSFVAAVAWSLPFDWWFGYIHGWSEINRDERFSKKWIKPYRKWFFLIGGITTALLTADIVMLAIVGNS